MYLCLRHCWLNSNQYLYVRDVAYDTTSPVSCTHVYRSPDWSTKTLNSLGGSVTCYLIVLALLPLKTLPRVVGLSRTRDRSFRCFSHCDLCNSSPASGEIYRFLQDLEDRLRWNLKRFENDKETAYIFLCESCSRTWNMLEGTVCSSNYFCFSI